jgi:hypothetical protein
MRLLSFKISIACRSRELFGCVFPTNQVRYWEHYEGHNRQEAVAAAAILFGAGAAWADSIPRLRGHDHTGLTAPDIKAAMASAASFDLSAHRVIGDGISSHFL